MNPMAYINIGPTPLWGWLVIAAILVGTGYVAHLLGRGH